MREPTWNVALSGALIHKQPLYRDTERCKGIEVQKSIFEIQ